MFPIPRLLRPAAAFAIVTTVYGLYALAVVP